jgi:ferredoxin
MDTVTLTIDGQSVTVPKGTTVLQAAINAGISVPYYCYHPGISIDGSCRVCVVKIEKMGKLQTSCSTTCTDGMVVSTRDPETVEARAGVLEFLLVNHPLDCPVCDQGGGCPLQDYAHAFARGMSRATGKPCTAPIVKGPTDILIRLMRAHGRNDANELLRGADVLAWLETTAYNFRSCADERRVEFAGGWTPTGLARWLDAGRPCRVGSTQQGREHIGVNRG